MFTSLAPDDSFGRVALAALDAPNGARYVTPLVCERVYFAPPRGVCLVTEDQRGATPTRQAYIFDDQFQKLHKIRLAGPPSRTRLSPDGRRAAITVFDEGHSYADGAFSTKTILVDTMSGNVLGDLEAFAVSRDGQRFADADFNFWGVTFASDGNRFYATLRSHGVPYLIEGNADAREARVLKAGVECPSLSPGQTRVAFKRRIGGTRGWWQVSILDLSTMAERALSGDTRSVDDQVEWLDEGRVLYFLPSNAGNHTWVLAAGDQAPAQIFIEDASSPAVVR